MTFFQERKKSRVLAQKNMRLALYKYADIHKLQLAQANEIFYNGFFKNITNKTVEPWYFICALLGGTVPLLYNLSRFSKIFPKSNKKVKKKTYTLLSLINSTRPIIPFNHQINRKYITINSKYRMLYQRSRSKMSSNHLQCND